MITAGDFYSVMCAIVPLYAAMIAAYAAVRWWRIFSQEQCSGINRFVAAFAVPVLSFHFISTNDPYAMDARFIAADTLAKLVVLAILSSWAIAARRGSGGGGGRLGWVITLFSLGTLPNTLVMGIPLLKAMYGDFTQNIMVQLVVLQCIIWYTLLLFLLEYRAATQLIRDQLHGGGAGSITAISVDGDVISLDGRDPLIAESEPDPDLPGRLRVRIRRCSASSTPCSAASRQSSLSGVEIYSVNTPGRPPQLTVADVALGGYASSDAYSLQPTPRTSNFDQADVGRSPPTVSSQTSPAVTVVWEGRGEHKDVGEKELSFRRTSKLAGGEVHDCRQMPPPAIMFKLILTVVGRKLSRNPNTYSSVLGLLWSLISFKWGISMPTLVLNSIKIVSDAGLGMAMFSLGLFMALQPRIIACGTKMAMMGMAIRFMCGPLVMSAASLALGLKGVRLHTAIVQAALPQGIVPFVFAREYGLHPDILSTMVIFGMLVSLPVTLLYYILLGL